MKASEKFIELYTGKERDDMGKELLDWFKWFGTGLTFLIVMAFVLLFYSTLDKIESHRLKKLDAQIKTALLQTLTEKTSNTMPDNSTNHRTGDSNDQPLENSFDSGIVNLS